MPTPSAVMRYHVQGPCVVQATVGALAAFADVGIAEDGVDLEFRSLAREIKTDGGGGRDGAPVNYYFLNATVIARCAFVPYNGLYVSRLRAAAQANITAALLTTNAVDGVMVQSGTLYQSITQANLVRVQFFSIGSNDPDGGFYLKTCLVKAAGDMKASPDATKPRWEFHAVNAYDPSTAQTISGMTLYQRV